MHTHLWSEITCPCCSVSQVQVPPRHSTDHSVPSALRWEWKLREEQGLDLVTGFETGWDLGPGALCYRACIWTNISLSNKIQKNYKGLKITACMCSWGKLWTTRYQKDKQKTNCHFWKAGSKNTVSEAKAGYCTCLLHWTPPKGWANHLSHPSSPTLGPAPTLTPRKEPAHHPLGEQARESVTCFCSPLLQQGPQ